MVDVSPGRWFQERARRSPGRAALTFDGGTRTYKEMAGRVRRLAGVLADGGVTHGMRVGYLGHNHPVAFEVLLAASYLGAIFVPVNVRLAPPEAEHVVRDAGVHTLVVGHIPGQTREDVPPSDLVPRVLAVGRGWEDVSDVEDLIARTPEPLGLGVHPAPKDVAVLVYTSGTTGAPKGAMLTNDNLWWNNINALHALDVSENEVAIVVAPVFHIAGINGLTLRTWQKGGEVVLLERFDPGLVLALVAERRVTTLFGVPTMLKSLAEHPTFDTTDLSSLRTLLCSSAPVPSTLLRRYEERGLAVHQGYGLTEAAPIVTMLGADRARDKVGSAGLPAMFCEISLVDPDGRAVDRPGTAGEIWVRGPNVMKGYWKRPEATAEVIDPQGWLHTGDIGYQDREGFLYVVDRLKDLIITGGENVYPAEVEAVAAEHPGVAEVAVVGVPDSHWGERVGAAVVSRPGFTIRLEDLRAHCGARLARYKLPSVLSLMEELPRNSTGKVLRREVVSHLTEGHGPTAAPTSPSGSGGDPSTLSAGTTRRRGNTTRGEQHDEEQLHPRP